jgi:hypothetical protein
MGLIEADALRGSMLPLEYDGKWDGQKGQWHPHGTPPAPHRDGLGSLPKNGANPHGYSNGRHVTPLAAKNVQPEAVCNGAS